MATKNKKILIAEDEKPLARALTLKLEKHGFETDSVSDGISLNEMVKKNQYDLILMDLMMPHHDGFEFIKKQKDVANAPPVVVLSNLGQTSDKERAVEMGAQAYFVKASTSLAEVVDYIKTNIK